MPYHSPIRGYSTGNTICVFERATNSQEFLWYGPFELCFVTYLILHIL